ncbi:uncharacterized protein LOC128882670 isoform X2 [Hylaeus volcanicus]|uniref:uncharacterized protein LOC128882670 isoform X2 n=1 Tax=Hylaeus volcanicus TaxID=313075 RepID=UPI0023B79D61|nr:uncharacterized protein LOC128882670 isoform X2 [Hylaeus volcanicus]
MLVRCETKSNRVKGLCFHPKLSWVLASLHNGVIQLWDYRIGTLIHRFEEHEGPVRGISFHISQPMFVSGGDDYKIKVWNYNQRRCVFTLLSHLDYIRTVEFHPEYPWILSSSDDQTVRIWNWQNRSCIALLAGHNHYVMCAQVRYLHQLKKFTLPINVQFHPKQDLVVSSSLDQSIRVWDISGLKNKYYNIHTTSGSDNNLNRSNTTNTGSNLLILSAQQSDMFGTTDAVCKFILEGHDRGVNWATFHPTVSLIASGGDDRTVRLWRFNDTKWWEVDTFRGHTNNVSSVIFHPTKEILLSNSEDRTIRVWDITKRVLLHTYRRENDRFWILAAHPSSNLIGVGHDSGTVIFKLYRERLACQVVDKKIFFVKDGWFSFYDCTSSSITTLVGCRRITKDMGTTNGCRALCINTFNPNSFEVLLTYKDSDTTEYDLIKFPSIESVISSPGNASVQQGTTKSITFCTRNRLARLDSSKSISLLTTKLEFNKRLELDASISEIFFAGNNRLILKSDESALLYDVYGKTILAELSCPGGIRNVSWSHDFKYVALLCKHYVVLATAAFEYLSSFYETIRIKGAAWDPAGAFIYTTLSHVKYCLPNGDNGIIRCLTSPFYVVKVENQTMWGYDAFTQTITSMALDCTEFFLKIALSQKQFSQAASLMRYGRLCGNAIVNYLRKRDHANVALQFVTNHATRFNLALEGGNLDVAFVEAGNLNDTALWDRLATETMRQGKFDIVETVHQTTKNFNKLSFLYFLAGDRVKLGKMLKISQMREDVQSCFFNALLLGDVEERIRVLTSMGQLPLAAMTARLYKLDDISVALEEALGRVHLDTTISPTATPFLPIETAVSFNDHMSLDHIKPWPQIIQEEKPLKKFHLSALGISKAVDSSELSTQWNTDSKSLPHTQKINDLSFDSLHTLDETEEITGWKDDDAIDNGDLLSIDDIDPEEIDLTEKIISSKCQIDSAETQNFKVGESPVSLWCTKGAHVFRYVAAGRYDEALEILIKKIALINAEPLKPFFRTITLSSVVDLTLLPLLPTKQLHLLQTGSFSSKRHQPLPYITISSLQKSFNDASRLLVAGKLTESLQTYREILWKLTLAEASSKKEEEELLAILKKTQIYALAMSIECSRQVLPDTDVRRNVELAAYLGCCELDEFHQFLIWRRALSVAWKAKNYMTAAIFARKLVETNFGSGTKGFESTISQAKKALNVAETRGTDAYCIDFDFTESENFVLCTSSLTRITTLENRIQCPFCRSVAKASFEKSLCSICQLCSLGAQVSGLSFLSMQ